MVLQNSNDVMLDILTVYNPCTAGWTAAVDVENHDCEELLVEMQAWKACSDVQRCCAATSKPQRSICDHPKMQQMEELLAQAVRLEEIAEQVQKYPQGTREWEDAVKSFWCIDAINAESLRSSYRRYARMYHPDKLAGFSGASRVTAVLAEKLIGIYGHTIEPQYHKAVDFLNREHDEAPCEKPYGIKHYVLEQDGDLILRILCTPIKSDVDTDDSAGTLVHANIPGEKRDGSDDTNATCALLYETVKETFYRVNVTEANGSEESIVVMMTLCGTNVTCNYVFTNCACISVVKDIFPKSVRVTMLTSSGCAVNDSDLLLSYSNCVLHVVVEDRHNCGFGVDISLTDYPWVFKPYGMFGREGVTIKLQRSPLQGEKLQSEEVELQFLAKLDIAPSGEDILHDDEISSETSEREESQSEEGCSQLSSLQEGRSEESVCESAEPSDIERARKRARVWYPSNSYMCGRHMREHEEPTCCRLNNFEYDEVSSDSSKREELQNEERCSQLCSSREERSEESVSQGAEPIDVEPAKKRTRVWYPDYWHTCVMHIGEHEEHTCCHLNKVEYDKVRSESAKKKEAQNEEWHSQVCLLWEERPEESVCKCAEPSNIVSAKKRARVWYPCYCYRCGRHISEHEGHRYCNLDKVEYNAMMESKLAYKQYCAAKLRRRQTHSEYDLLRTQVRVINHRLNNICNRFAWQPLQLHFEDCFAKYCSPYL